MLDANQQLQLALRDRETLRRAQATVDQLYLGLTLAYLAKRSQSKGGRYVPDIAGYQRQLRWACARRDEIRDRFDAKVWKRVEYYLQKHGKRT